MPRRERPLPDWVSTPPRPPRSVLLTAWIDPAAVRTPRHLEIVRALPVHRRVWLAPDAPEPENALPAPALTVEEILAGPLADLKIHECGVVLLTGVRRKQAKEFQSVHGPGRVLLVRCSPRAGLFDYDADRVLDHCVRYDPPDRRATPRGA